MVDRLDLPFPFGGLSENYQFSLQEPGTSRSVKNMRPVNRRNGRVMGSQRSGFTRWNTNQLSGANKVQALAPIVTPNTLLSFAEDTSGIGTDAWAQIATKGTGTSSRVTRVEVDVFGNIYLLDALFGVIKTNQDGEILATMQAPIDLPAGDGSNEAYLRSMAVDDLGNVFIGAGDPHERHASSTTALQELSRVWAFRIGFDEEYELAWELEDNGTSQRYVEALVWKNGDLYVAYVDREGINGGHAVFVYQDVTMDAAPVATITAINGANGLDAFPRAMAVRDDGILYVCGDDYASVQWISKWSPQNVGTAPVWELTQATTSGIGMGLALGEKTNDGQWVYSCGTVTAEPAIEVRRLLDEGRTVSKVAAGTWAVDPSPVSAININEEAPIQMAVDEDFNLYLPWNGGASSGQPQVIAFAAAAGTEVWQYDQGTPDFGPKCVGIPVSPKPEYGASAVDVVEYVYLGHAKVTAANIVATYIRGVNATQSGTGLRTTSMVGVSNGNIVTFTRGGTAPADPGGGTGVGALDSGAPYVGVASLFQRVYFTDGINYRYYDIDDDAVVIWRSKTQGTIPPRCRLITTWRGRIVIARDPEDPQNWHMSAVANPHDWNNFPAFPAATQAISGNNAKAGLVPDIVNTMIPYADDLLLFGCDKSIWRLTGDPMQGGSMDFVTDDFGMSFGQPWCKDTRGVLYFFESRGGVARWAPGSQMPEALSDNRLQRKFQDVNLATHHMRLVWNHRDDGLHVFQIPYGTVSVKQHWFWHRKTGSWWEDEYGGGTTTQPTAVVLFDGDAANDRTILVGGNDGYVREWNEDAVDDDGAAIDAHFAIGPIAPVPPAGGLESGYDELTAVLASDEHGCTYEVYVGSEPDDPLSAPFRVGRLSAGRNPAELAGWSGDTCYLRLRNANALESFSYEEASVRVWAAGRKGPR